MRINEGVDPRMIGMEYAHAKHGLAFPLRGKVAPASRLTRQHQTDASPRFVPTRIVRHLARRPYREGAA